MARTARPVADEAADLMGVYAPAADAYVWSKIHGLGPETIDGFMAREELAPGYDPGDYAGPTFATRSKAPWDQEWDRANRVGVFGSDTITSIDEGSGTSQIRVFSTPGEVIQNRAFYCTVDLKAAGLQFINCLFAGPPTIEKQAIVATNSGANPTRFTDSTVVVQNPNRWASASIHSTGAAFYKRCDFYGVSDAVTPGGRWTGGVTIEDSAFHDMIMYGPDPGAAGGIDDAITHVDQTQMVGGSLWIRRSSYRAFYSDDAQYMQANQPPVGFGGTPVNPRFHQYGNRYYPDLHTTSALMFSPATFPIDQFEFTDGFVDGAVFPINFAGMTSAGSIKFNRNKVGNSRRSTGPGDLGPSSYKTLLARAALQPFIEATGNVRAVDGTALSKADLIQNG